MPMYPYRIPSKYGRMIYPFDTESNVTANLLPDTLVSLHRPSPETKKTGRALIVQPIHYGGNVAVASNDRVTLADIQHLIGEKIGTTSDGVPIIMGNPIERSKIRSGVITTIPVEIPGKPKLIPIWVVVILIVAIAIMAAVIASNVSETILRMHAMDLVLQAQQVVRREYYDLDTGKIDTKPFEGADIMIIYYRNGEVIQVALNEKGKEYLNGHSQTVKKGKDFDDLLRDITETSWIQNMVTWIAIGAVAIGGVYLAVKIIPMLVERYKVRRVVV